MEDGQDYIVSHFAVYLLATRHGTDRVQDYWRLIGQGHAKEDAFRQLFEMSVSDYETLFENLRRDRSDAINFVSGKG